MTTFVGWGGQHIGQFTNTLASLQSGLCGVRRLLAVLLNVPTNVTNTDFQFTLGNATNFAGTTSGTGIVQGTLGPAGYTGTTFYAVRDFQANNPLVGSSAAATAGLFTAAGGAGTTIVTNVALSNLSAATATLNQYLVIAAGGTGNLFTNVANPSLFLRIGTASGVANTTADFYCWGEVMP